MDLQVAAKHCSQRRWLTSLMPTSSSSQDLRSCPSSTASRKPGYARSSRKRRKHHQVSYSSMKWDRVATLSSSGPPTDPTQSTQPSGDQEDSTEKSRSESQTKQADTRSCRLTPAPCR